MKICLPHWGVCRELIEQYGLSPLVAQDGAEAVNQAIAELNGTKSAKTFDPLMSMNSHWWRIALEYGGIGMMGETPDGSNDGHFCPLCELASHYADFDVRTEVGMVAQQMVEYARKENLIPPLM